MKKNCFIGMFDILGFKLLRNSKGTDGLHQLLMRTIVPAIQFSVAGKIKLSDDQRSFIADFDGSSCVKYQIFSDTVILVTPDDSFESFFDISNSAFMLLKFGFSGAKTPYRGAIGWGDLINDPQHNILIGSAIEDAYAGECLQAWSGAMLTDSCRDFCEQNNYIKKFKDSYIKFSDECLDEKNKKSLIEDSFRLVSYSVPIKTKSTDGSSQYNYSEQRTIAIDWTIKMYEGASEKSFYPSDNEHVNKIIENTKSFEQWARLNNRS